MSVQRTPPLRALQPRRRVSLWIEPLEDRLAPAVITWTGQGSDFWSDSQNWSGGPLVDNPDAELVFPAGGRLTSTNDLSNLTLKSIRFDTSGYLVTGQPATLREGVSTTFSSGSVVMSTDFSLLNAQSINVSAVNASLTLAGVLSGGAAATLTKAGSGNLALTGQNTHAGGTTLAAGALQFPTSNALGTGTLRLNGGTLQPTTAMTISNSVTVGGAATISATNAVTLSGAISLVTSMSLAINNTAPTTISGTFSWTGGTLSATGTVVIAATGLLSVDGADDKTLLSGTYQNSGTNDFGGGGTIYLGDKIYLTNSLGGIIRILTDLVIRIFSGSGTFQNSGTFSRPSGSGVAELEPGIDFQNTGTLAVGSGTLKINELTNSGTVTIDNSTLQAGDAITPYLQTAGTTSLSNGNLVLGSSLNLQAGVLTGNGSISGNVQNAGTIRPGGVGGIGTLSISGNYTQTAVGVMALDLAVGGFDQVQVTGTATLAGTLRVTALAGFNPNVGDGFQVFLFGARVGDFSTYDLPNLWGGRYLDPVFDLTSLTLVVRQG